MIAVRLDDAFDAPCNNKARLSARVVCLITLKYSTTRNTYRVFARKAAPVDNLGFAQLDIEFKWHSPVVQVFGIRPSHQGTEGLELEQLSSAK